MRKILACLALIALTSCAGVSANVTSSQASSTDPAQQLMAFVVTDLKAADQISKSTGDTVGTTCYDYLIPKVVALQTAAAFSNANSAGAISFAEVQRGTVSQINDLKSGLNVACAPLVLDTANTLTQLGLKFGAVATLPLPVPLP